MSSSRTLRLDKHLLGGFLILLAAAGLIALTWFGTISAIEVQRAETSAHVAATVANQALAVSEQIRRQILALDQTLRGLTRTWEANPSQFNLEQRRANALVLTGISQDMLLVDANGVIQQSSVPEAVGQSAAASDFMGYAQDHQSDPEALRPGLLFIGGAGVDRIMRQWHLNVAQWLHGPDGAFAGAMIADYRLSAILDIFWQADVGPAGLVMLLDATNGRLRASLGPTDTEPNIDLSGSPLMNGITAAASGLWTGPSGTDAVRRIHAFRRLPDRDLIVVVAMNEQNAMRAAEEWQREATLFAGCITLLLLIATGASLLVTLQARSRGRDVAEERALLAATNAQLEIARARADAKAEQLQVTLAGMTDGIAMMDQQLHLVEWNAQFPALAGIPPGVLRVGLPMEEVLRAQVATGQFGAVDQEAEIVRRMALLRTGSFGTTQRTRPDGRVLELRRNGLPDGGFVTLYADITERRMAENALREARAIAEAANTAKSRFVAIVSHEIRTPLNALLNTLRLLADSALAPQHRALVDMANQSGDALSGLINDILDMARFEAGQLTLRASVFVLRPLLDGAVDMFRAQAGARGISLHVNVAPGVPEQLVTDPGRLRQVLLNLLSNAVKFARPGTVWLLVECHRTAGSEPDCLRFMVRDQGPVIEAEDRACLFRPFTRIERAEDAATDGSGLGLAICHHIVTLIGGEIGCDAWPGESAAAPFTGGNSFWFTLPPSVLATPAPVDPDRPAVTPRSAAAVQTPAARAARTAAPPQRPLPRTRVLLVEDVPSNRFVTATMLRRAGHLVDVAATGDAAVRAASTTPYDIVFMDIYMPGMSGLEAAQRIRGLPGAAGAVPIVALTGQAEPDDAATFRAAGMNGALSKPVSWADLQAAVAHHAWPGHPSGAAPAPAPPSDPPPSDPPPPDPLAATNQSPIGTAILNPARITELQNNIPADTLIRLIEACLTDIEDQLPPFRRALDAGLSTAVATQAHTMAGIAASYGMTALETRLRGIMVFAAALDRTAGDRPAFEGAFAAVAADYDRAATALRDIFKNKVV